MVTDTAHLAAGQGELCVSFGSGFISAAEVGARTDHAIPLIAPLRQLSKLTFFR
jgi:hypothetical protein